MQFLCFGVYSKPMAIVVMQSLIVIKSPLILQKFSLA